MKEQFVSFDIASKLKDLGFDGECLCTYRLRDKRLMRNPGMHMDDEPILEDPYYWINSKVHYSVICAPLWQQCLDWLREKHGLYVYFKPDKTNNIGDVEFVIEKHWPDEVICREICMIYEHAREDGILKALTLIK